MDNWLDSSLKASVWTIGLICIGYVLEASATSGTCAQAHTRIRVESRIKFSAWWRIDPDALVERLTPIPAERDIKILRDPSFVLWPFSNIYSRGAVQQRCGRP